MNFSVCFESCGIWPVLSSSSCLATILWSMAVVVLKSTTELASEPASTMSLSLLVVGMGVVLVVLKASWNWDSSFLGGNQ